MANKRPQAPTFMSSKGIFRFPKVSEIDFGTKEFPKPNGEYSVQLIVRADDPKVQALIQKLEPLHQQAQASAEVAFKALKAESRKKLGAVKVNPLYTELLDQETEEPTGDLSFKFAVNASGEYKNGKKAGRNWDTRPTVFDRYKKPLIEGFRFRDREEEETITDVHQKGRPDIWGGTTGYVAFEVGVDATGNPGYFIAGTAACGLKLGLLAVQVIDVVSAGARTADDYGFGGDEDDAVDPSDAFQGSSADF